MALVVWVCLGGDIFGKFIGCIIDIINLPTYKAKQAPNKSTFNNVLFYNVSKF